MVQLTRLVVSARWLGLILKSREGGSQVEVGRKTVFGGGACSINQFPGVSIKF